MTNLQSTISKQWVGNRKERRLLLDVLWFFNLQQVWISEHIFEHTPD